MAWHGMAWHGMAWHAIIKVCLPILLATIIGFASANLFLYCTKAPSFIQEDELFPDPSKVLGLHVEPELFDMGHMWETSHHDHDLHVKNLTDKPIHIHSWHSTCNCTSVEPSSVTIPARNSVSVRLTIDLTKKPLPLKPGQIQEFKLRLTPNIEGAKSLPHGIGWVLSGSVQRLIHVDSDSTYLGVYSEDSLPIEAELVVVSERPLTDLQLKIQSRESGWRSELLQENTSNRYRIRLQSPDRIEVGKSNVQLRLVPIMDSGEMLPDKHLTVTTMISQDVVADPPAVVFGVSEIGSLQQEQIYLRSMAGNSLNEVRVVSKSKGVSVTPVAHERTESYRQFTIVQQVLSKGEHNGWVDFEVNTTSKIRDKHRVRVSVQFNGIQDSP